MATAELIGALYANMNNFPVFIALSLLYFSAVSYSEAMWRLGKAKDVESFLLCDDPGFWPECLELFAEARRPAGAANSAALIQRIHVLIEPFDVVGLGRTERRNWYPVDPDDLHRSAKKLGANREEIDAMLMRCGITPRNATMF